MLITCWGRSANRAKSSGAKCYELEEGHPLLMDGVRKGIRAGATFSCALWRRERPMQSSEAGRLGLRGDLGCRGKDMSRERAMGGQEC